MTSNIKVLLPLSLHNSDYIGNVYGFFHKETKVYNIVAWDVEASNKENNSEIKLLGRIENSLINKSKNDGIVGIRKEGNLEFYWGQEICTIELYDLTQNVFSRNQGILETDWMLNKNAIILGCGSVGSLVALELTRAGVGEFVLVDNDVIEYHNLCRHQCGIQDVGKLKVSAVKKRITDINPGAEVKTYSTIVEDLSKQDWDDFCTNNSIIVGCADNRHADRYASQLAKMYKTPFVAIGFWERAFAGEVFYSLPEKDMPCYECALSNSVGSEERNKNRRFYTTQENLREVNFEPGISVDINFVTLVGVKIIIDILNMNNPKFTPRLLPSLTQYTLICNTNNPKIGGDMAEIFSYPLQVTTSLKVGFIGECPPCKYSP